MPGLVGGIVHERLATKCSQLHLVADCVNFAPYILDHNSAVKRPEVNNSFIALRFACFVQKRRPGSCQVFIDINIIHCFSQLLYGAHHGHLTCITLKLNNDRSRACLRLVGIAPLSNTVRDVFMHTYVPMVAFNESEICLCTSKKTSLNTLFQQWNVFHI